MSKCTYVYFIQATSGPIKIGFSARPKRRLMELQTMHFETLTLRGVLAGSLLDEQRMHHQLQASRIRGEWYRPTVDVLARMNTAHPLPPDTRSRRSPRLPSPEAEELASIERAARRNTGGLDLRKELQTLPGWRMRPPR